MSGYTNLLEYYTNAFLPIKSKPSIPEVTKDNVIEVLSKAFDFWTWETASDFAISEYKRVLEVRVYIPCQVLYGRTVYDTHTNLTETAHLLAIVDACKSIVNKSILPAAEQFNNNKRAEQPVTPAPQPAQVAKPIQGVTISDDELMNIINMNNAAVNTQPQKQIDSVAELQNDPRTEVPFDQISDKCFNEMATNMNPTVPAPQPTPTPAPTGDRGPYAFTQEEINAVLQFKKDFNIANDEMFGNYINSWNPKLSTKKDLTTANIASFLEWVKNLGECPC